MSSNSTVDVSPVHTRFGFVSANVWGVSHTVFFFQAEAGIRDGTVTGVQTCALPISLRRRTPRGREANHFDLGRRQALPADAGSPALAARPRGVRRRSVEVELFALGPGRLEGVVAEALPDGCRRSLPRRLVDGIALIPHSAPRARRRTQQANGLLVAPVGRR